MKENILTLDEFTHEQLRMIPNATGMLSALLRDIGLAAKRIGAAVNKAGLTTILGAADLKNVHHEEVQQLDLYAHKQLREVLKSGHSCAGILSEEMEGIEVFDDTINNKSKYVVAFEHLVAHKNIDFSNSMIEYTNKRIKYDYLYRQHFTDLEDLARRFPDFVKDFNSRPNNIFNGLSNDEVLNGQDFKNVGFTLQLADAKKERIIENKKLKCCFSSF